MRATFLLTSTTVLLLGLAGCSTVSRSGYDPHSESGGGMHRADTAFEIGAIADELAERAESRTSLGTARIQIGALDAIEPRKSPYRQVTLLERDLRATQATIRHELEMALGNRMNLVGAGADLATHAIEGEFLRSADSLDLSLRLVELKSDWIVATARRTIEDFVPEFYDRRLQAPADGLPDRGSSTEAASSGRYDREEQDGAVRSRALRPAYPAPGSTYSAPSSDSMLGPNIASTPRPSDVLTSGAPPEELPASGASAEAPKAPVDGPLEEPLEGPVEFDRGPAAARLRANGDLPPAAKASDSREQ
ncbi:hypothetical protein Poly30_35940 [Planctomycetes bacterium Poly30]|uniref:Uncharacterized protein n=1 Tax=Saltatorellus ferox TaxID=2528018 RepID=A0A518EVG8_9BACT|nr:hypothetical protein Poly30_35940 [Planctomycetes bacterium Poly30]